MAHDNTVFKNTSWGRTRSPKNIINSNHESPTSVVLTGAGGAGTATSAAYVTENQRFLHISHIAANDNAACTIQVQVKMHASGVFANLGSTISSTSARTHNIVEIQGADQVRFVVSNLADGETCTIFPVSSTF